MNYDKIMCVITYYHKYIEPSIIKTEILLHVA